MFELTCLYFVQSLFKVFERRQEMATLSPPYRKMTMYRLVPKTRIESVCLCVYSV